MSNIFQLRNHIDTLVNQVDGMHGFKISPKHVPALVGFIKQDRELIQTLLEEFKSPDNRMIQLNFAGFRGFAIAEVLTEEFRQKALAATADQSQSVPATT